MKKNTEAAPVALLPAKHKLPKIHVHTHLQIMIQEGIADLQAGKVIDGRKVFNQLRNKFF